MNYYVNYDEITGKFKGFYNDLDHGTSIPEPNIILTELQWKDAYENQQLRKVDVVNRNIIESPLFTNEELLNRIRLIRNDKLIKSDWTQVNDSPLTTEKRTEWATYRQALRDFPTTCDPVNPVWPTEPTA